MAATESVSTVSGMKRRILFVAAVACTIIPFLALYANLVAGRVRIDDGGYDSATGEFRSLGSENLAPGRLLYSPLAPLSFGAIIPTKGSPGNSPVEDYEVRIYYFLTSLGYEWPNAPTPQTSAGTIRTADWFYKKSPAFQFPTDLITVARSMGLDPETYWCVEEDHKGQWRKTDSSQPPLPWPMPAEQLAEYHNEEGEVDFEKAWGDFYRRGKGHFDKPWCSSSFFDMISRIRDGNNIAKDVYSFYRLIGPWVHFGVDSILLYRLFVHAILPYLKLKLSIEEEIRLMTEDNFELGLHRIWWACAFQMLSTCTIAMEVSRIKMSFDVFDEWMGRGIRATYSVSFFSLRMFVLVSVAVATVCWSTLIHMEKERQRVSAQPGVGDKKDQ